MNKYLLGVIALVGLVGCGSVSAPGQPNTLANAGKEYSLEEIGQHNKASDCWLLIGGKVYDVSSYASHPGGKAMLEGCGRDATILFDTRPMGPNTPHSTKAKQMLDKFYAGDLKK